jgi:hypothetical protein
MIQSLCFQRFFGEFRLNQVSALEPKSSASTSSATPATGIATNMASVYNTAFFAAATELTLK